jgi:3-oxoacyl-[acyl-carrier protein] reductase
MPPGFFQIVGGDGAGGIIKYNKQQIAREGQAPGGSVVGRKAMSAVPDLRGKVALVTGGSRGIGAAVAVALAEAGADVAINYRERAGAAEKIAKEIEAAGRRAIAVAADVSNSGAVAKMMERISAALGPIDILVNNAGIGRRRAPEELDEAEWDATIDVNLKGAFLCTQAVLPAMQARGFGRIVNITSGAARGPGGIGVHYNASKAGLEGLTRGYAARLAKTGVTVNAVAPSLIETDMIPGGEARTDGPGRAAGGSGADRRDGGRQRLHDRPDRPGEWRDFVRVTGPAVRRAGNPQLFLRQDRGDHPALGLGDEPRRVGLDGLALRRAIVGLLLGLPVLGAVIGNDPDELVPLRDDVGAVDGVAVLVVERMDELLPALDELVELALVDRVDAKLRDHFPSPLQTMRVHRTPPRRASHLDPPSRARLSAEFAATALIGTPVAD